MKQGTLYIVGTPIGNLEDMSFRAVRILGEVDLIAAEDTRHTKKLLSHYNIHKPLESYHKFNEKQKSQKLITLLLEDKNIALVTNAGMPGISDPGEILVKLALSQNTPVIPIPGPTASIIGLVTSGLATDRFLFEGFLPRKKGLRTKTLENLKIETRTLIFYESALRVKNTIKEIYNIFGDRDIAIARELTKKFEETIRGKCSIMFALLEEKVLKGECVLVVSGAKLEKENFSKTDIIKALKKLQKEDGASKKDAIKILAKELNVPKNHIYQIAIEN